MSFLLRLWRLQEVLWRICKIVQNKLTSEYVYSIPVVIVAGDEFVEVVVVVVIHVDWVVVGFVVGRNFLFVAGEQQIVTWSQYWHNSIHQQWNLELKIRERRLKYEKAFDFIKMTRDFEIDRFSSQLQKGF